MVISVTVGTHVAADPTLGIDGAMKVLRHKNSRTTEQSYVARARTTPDVTHITQPLGELGRA